MITNFEEETAVLTPEEMQLIPVLCEQFKIRTKSFPMKAPDIIKRINFRMDELGMKHKLTGPRFRKMCNYIRSNGLIPLIATSAGYYVSYDREEINRQIKSLDERGDAIKHAAVGLRKFLYTAHENRTQIQNL